MATDYLWSDLPESCAAEIFIRMKPVHILQSALVCKAWARAAGAANVWESFLPANYRKLCSRAFPDPMDSADPKICYRKFCEGFLAEEGKKYVGLDRNTGALSVAVSVAGAMGIVGGDDLRYWAMEETLSPTCFKKTAHLLAVCWFQLGGDVEVQLPRGKYNFFWRLSRDKTDILFPSRGATAFRLLPGQRDARAIDFDWENGEVYSKVIVSGGPILEEALPLEEADVAVFPEWSDFPCGETEVQSFGGEEAGLLELKAELHEIKRGSWKSGLYVDSFIIKQCSELE